MCENKNTAKGPLLIDTGRGFNIFYKNFFLYNKTDPVEKTESRIKKLFLREETLYLVTSPLLFYGILNLLDRLPPGSRIICIEVDDELKTLSEKHVPDYIKQNPLISFPEIKNFNDLSEHIKAAGLHNFRRVEHISISGGYRLNKDIFQPFITGSENLVAEYWKNRMTLVHMAPLWIRNIFRNYSFFSKQENSDRLSAEKYSNYPMIVAGAGESLEGSLSIIKQHRNKVKVLSVDTAAGILLSNGITPDFIIAEDAQFYNLYDFYGFINRDTTLIFDMTGYPGILKKVKGKVIPYISRFSNSNLFEHLEKYNLLPRTIPPMGSVGISALYFALLLTSGGVFYTGLDFSYVIGKSHAKGSPRHISELSDSFRLSPMEQPEIYYKRPLLKIKDKNGNPAFSDLVLNSYSGILGDMYADSERVFDIGSQGLSAGVKRISSDQLMRQDFFMESLPSGTCSTVPLPDLRNAEDFLNNEKRLIDQIYKEGYRYLSGDKADEDYLYRLIKNCDYLYLHFPDKNPDPLISPDYIKRVLQAAAYYSNVIDKALKVNHF